MSGGSCCQPAVPSQGWHRGGHGRCRPRALLRARKDGGKRESGLLLLFSTPGVGLVGITARLGSAQGREPVWGRGQDARGVPGSEDAVLEKRSEEQGPREITAPKSPLPTSPHTPALLCCPWPLPGGIARPPSTTGTATLVLQAPRICPGFGIPRQLGGTRFFHAGRCPWSFPRLLCPCDGFQPGITVTLCRESPGSGRMQPRRFPVGCRARKAEQFRG